MADKTTTFGIETEADTSGFEAAEAANEDLKDSIEDLDQIRDDFSSRSEKAQEGINELRDSTKEAGEAADGSKRDFGNFAEAMEELPGPLGQVIGIVNRLGFGLGTAALAGVGFFLALREDAKRTKARINELAEGVADVDINLAKAKPSVDGFAQGLSDAAKASDDFTKGLAARNTETDEMLRRYDAELARLDSLAASQLRLEKATIARKVAEGSLTEAEGREATGRADFRAGADDLQRRGRVEEAKVLRLNNELQKLEAEAAALSEKLAEAEGQAGAIPAGYDEETAEALERAQARLAQLKGDLNLLSSFDGVGKFGKVLKPDRDEFLMLEKEFGKEFTDRVRDIVSIRNDELPLGGFKPVSEIVTEVLTEEIEAIGRLNENLTALQEKRNEERETERESAEATASEIRGRLDALEADKAGKVSQRDGLVNEIAANRKAEEKNFSLEDQTRAEEQRRAEIEEAKRKAEEEKQKREQLEQQVNADAAKLGEEVSALADDIENPQSKAAEKVKDDLERLGKALTDGVNSPELDQLGKGVQSLANGLPRHFTRTNTKLAAIVRRLDQLESQLENLPD